MFFQWPTPRYEGVQGLQINLELDTGYRLAANYAFPPILFHAEKTGWIQKKLRTPYRYSDHTSQTIKHWIVGSNLAKDTKVRIPANLNPG
jgi:hypothetical protein